MSKHILPHALRVPALEKLKGKRIVLASNSPRRKEILCTFVRVQNNTETSELLLVTHIMFLSPYYRIAISFLLAPSMFGITGNCSGDYSVDVRRESQHT